VKSEEERIVYREPNSSKSGSGWPWQADPEGVSSEEQQSDKEEIYSNPWFSDSERPHHHERYEDPTHHIKRDEPEWTIEINREEGSTRNPREKRKSDKKTEESFLGVSRKENKNHKSAHKGDIVEWSNTFEPLKEWREKRWYFFFS
jgi:hypothetical protein